jgi:hypothetical protein
VSGTLVIYAVHSVFIPIVKEIMEVKKLKKEKLSKKDE